MNLRTCLAKLEATNPPPSVSWMHCIHDPTVETLEDVIDRDFGGVRPENLIVSEIVHPAPRP